MSQRTRLYSDWRNDLGAAGFEFLGTWYALFAVQRTEGFTETRCSVFLILSLGTVQSLAYINEVRIRSSIKPIEC